MYTKAHSAPLHTLHLDTRKMHANKSRTLSTRQFLCIGLLMACIATTYYTLTHDCPYSKRVRSTSSWFNNDGLLEWDRSIGFDTTWTTFSSPRYTCDETVMVGDREACQSGIKVLQALSDNMQAQQRVLGGMEPEELEDTAQVIGALKGKRILIAGDSTDRNSFADLIAMLHSRPYMPAHPVFGAAAALIPIASHPSDVQHAAELEATFELSPTTPSPHLRIDQTFLVGTLADRDIDGYGPCDPAVRLESLAQAVGAVKDGRALPVYDAVYINAGLWDMAAIQRQTLNLHRDDPYPGLTPAQVDQYETGLHTLVDTAKRMFPGAAIVMRTLHDTNSTLFAGPAHPNDMTGVEHQHTFKPLRAVQMRQAQIRVAEKTGVGINPFASRMLGQGDITTDSVHPNLQANMVQLELLLRHLVEV